MTGQLTLITLTYFHQTRLSESTGSVESRWKVPNGPMICFCVITDQRSYNTEICISTNVPWHKWNLQIHPISWSIFFQPRSLKLSRIINCKIFFKKNISPLLYLPQSFPQGSQNKHLPCDTKSVTLTGDQLNLITLTYFHQTRASESPGGLESRKKAQMVPQDPFMCYQWSKVLYHWNLYISQCSITHVEFLVWHYLLLQFNWTQILENYRRWILFTLRTYPIFPSSLHLSPGQSKLTPFPIIPNLGHWQEVSWPWSHIIFYKTMF